MPRDRFTRSLLDEPQLVSALIATVAPLAPIDKTYSYLVPPEFESILAPGMRVTVPFGRGQRPIEAMCLEVARGKWDTTLKPILKLRDERPVLSNKLLELGRWLARYYSAHLGRTLDLMIPAAAKSRAGWRKVKYVTAASSEIPNSAFRIPNSSQISSPKLPPKQSALLELLESEGGRFPLAELCQRAACTPAVVASLGKKGLVRIETILEPVEPPPPAAGRSEPQFELTPDQTAAIAQINAAVESRSFSVQLLFGVTGSGKTEVYVSAIKQALSLGRQAIMLVPEIALTTQTVRRLEDRFERVATLHSGLSSVQRSRAWAAISAGHIGVVIGTRSAVFAPCPDLGVIIVDEEAEPSYKNQAAPRYHTRDVAVQRAHLEGIPVVLGSATPSLETWKNVREKKHYHLIRMPTRVRGLAMPRVHLVDMHEEHLARKGVHMLSRQMEAYLGGTLERGEQAVLLLNRRGYAGFLHCPRCRTVLTCPHCSVHLVFHATTQLAHCHYCHEKLTLPEICPKIGCGGPIVRFGIGTQRVEEELAEKFPAARVRRMDSDAMRTPADYADVLTAFEQRDFDILVGTQMIAKGLDFPFVSFVGIISADTALALNDFRSEERTFQLVLQVAGRSGRGDVGGDVVVQTFAADTAPIRHAVAGDYEGFANSELDKRRKAKLPPWTRMMRIVVSDPLMTRAQKAAAKLAESIRDTLQRAGVAVDLFGPLPAPISRIRDNYRFDLVLTFPTATALLTAIDAFKAEATLHAPARTIIVDVDPVSLQ
ncbi:MAG TPA: primosomal protein N' [Phycisphaerae bacterium]|nr:primosomal protein N' [Phycisphaerae bacterium]